MSQENVGAANIARVRSHLAALNERDLDRYLAGCTEDFELWSLLSALEGPYIGAEGVQRFFGDVKDAAPDHSKATVRIEPVGEDRVLSVDRWTATGRSSEVGQGEGIEIATVYEFRGDKIRRIRVFADVQEALAAVGLEK